MQMRPELGLSPVLQCCYCEVSRTFSIC
uniref:Uncharacterized protein n=1 Tax=Anguilla anguilla TaxID=7936 RepID=A0A0E9TTC9_ANGAN